VVEAYYQDQIPSNALTAALFAEGTDLYLEDPRDMGYVSNLKFALTIGHRFYITHSGFMGLCHKSVRPGDQICVISSGSVPFVIRQSHNMNGMFQNYPFARRFWNREMPNYFRSSAKFQRWKLSDPLAILCRWIRYRVPLQNMEVQAHYYELNRK
jgi:hypothetical protein